MIWLRALRLPFLCASVLPFCVGAQGSGTALVWLPFVLGLIATAATHLSANLVNDYADSRSGADWHDLTYHQGFFGGSKLIQEGRLSERWFLAAALLCGLVAVLAVAGLAWTLGSLLPLAALAVILGLAWAYSQPPLQLAYRGLGEPVIFLLFGPALVMGGRFTQTGVFTEVGSFCLSLPFAFLTTAILVANEVPDFAVDLKAGKRNWVQRLGRRRAYRLHAGLVLGAALSLALCVFVDAVPPAAAVAAVGLIPAAMASRRLLIKQDAHDVHRWLRASQLTIGGQALTGLLLLLAVSL